MQAGVTYGTLYEYANNHNLLLPGGASPTVGAAGGYLQVIDSADVLVSMLMIMLDREADIGNNSHRQTNNRQAHIRKSALSNTFGLAVDRVVRPPPFLVTSFMAYMSMQLQFKVVTPTGDYLVANQCQNTDLFFALRGGGQPKYYQSSLHRFIFVQVVVLSAWSWRRQ